MASRHLAVKLGVEKDGETVFRRLNAFMLGVSALASVKREALILSRSEFDEHGSTHANVKVTSLYYYDDEGDKVLILSDTDFFDTIREHTAAGKISLKFIAKIVRESSAPSFDVHVSTSVIVSNGLCKPMMLQLALGHDSSDLGLLNALPGTVARALTNPRQPLAVGDDFPSIRETQWIVPGVWAVSFGVEATNELQLPTERSWIPPFQTVILVISDISVTNLIPSVEQVEVRKINDERDERHRIPHVNRYRVSCFHYGTNAMRHQGACRCGSVEIAIDTTPFLVYHCHCSHCRAFATLPTSGNSGNGTVPAGNGAPYHAAAAVFRWNVHVPRGHDMLEYVSTVDGTGMFAMSRGRCRSCQDPMMEWCHRLATPFCMVPCQPLHPKLEPDANLFYDSGFQKGTNGLRVTIHSDLGSLLYEIWLILIVAIPSIPFSLWARLCRPKTSAAKRD